MTKVKLLNQFWKISFSVEFLNILMKRGKLCRNGKHGYIKDKKSIYSKFESDAQNGNQTKLMLNLNLKI